MISKKFIVSLLLSCSLFSFSYAQLPASGLVAHYPFSGNAQDAIGSNNGTVFGAQLTTNRFGQANSAYVFDGINDYISIADDDAIDFGYNQNFSISLWVLVDPTQNDLSGRGNEILSKWNDLTPTSYPYAIRYLNSTSTASDRNKVLALRFSSDPCTRAPALKSTCPLSLNVWHHMALVKNGSTLSYYQDGVLLGQVTDNTVAACDTKNSLPVHIAQRANNFFFKGKIDDVAFYNRSLTPAEINDIVFENGWTVPVVTPAVFTSFSIPQQVSPAVINTTNQTITLEVSCAANLNSLTSTFATSNASGATVGGVTQISGVTTNNFSAPVLYTLSNAGDCGTTNWTVTINQQAPSAATIEANTQITSFTVPGQVGPTTINPEAHAIDVVVSCQANLNFLVPDFSLSAGSIATVGSNQQTSGVSGNNFNNDVVYRVSNEAACGFTDWTVTVNKQSHSAATIDANTQITGFNVPGQVGPAAIDPITHTIDVIVPCQANLSFLIPNFLLSAGSIATVGSNQQISGVSGNNFTNNVLYRVSNAAVCGFTDWSVSITRYQASPTEIDFYTNLESFALPDQTHPATIDEATHTITLELRCSADDDQIASFTTATGSIVKVSGQTQISGTSSQNFSQTLFYTVENATYCVSQAWEVVATFQDITMEEIDPTNLQFFLPNIITPNGDSDNQHFMVGDFFRGSEFNLYNRYGKKVYENPSYQNEFNGGSLSSGVYYYTLRHPCLNESIKGFLHIIR